MVDLFKTETVNSDILIDETMSIVTADENFEAISGNNALFVYTRYIHPDDVSRFTEALKDYAESGKFIVVRMLYQTGEYHWMLTRITDGGVSETRGHMYDINIMDAALITTQIDNLNSQIERYSSYLGMCENVLFSYDILNDDFNVFMTSDGHQTLSFYRGTLNAWEEDKIKIDALGLNEVKELDGFCKALANGEKLFKREITINILNKPGRLDRCLARGNTIVDAYGNSIVIGTIIILESSDNHVVEELNIISDMKDPGTDLLNKRAITDYVRKLIDSQPGHTVTIAIIDIDDFKTINDTYGHMFGDEVLCKVADILRDAVGSRGLCGRIGGDEFMIVFNGINDDTMLRGRLRSIRTQIKWEFANDFEKTNITTSIGAAIYPNNGTEYEDLFKKADYCLYVAKEKGRDRYVFFRDDLHRKSYEESLCKKISNMQTGSRQIKEIEFMAQIMKKMCVSPKEAISECIKHIHDTYKLDSINFYSGENLKKVYTYGKVLENCDDALYAKSNEFKKMIGEEKYIQIGFVASYYNSAPEFCRIMRSRGVFSTLQCIIGSADDVRAVITFDKCGESSQWAEYEINCSVVFASFIELCLQMKDIKDLKDITNL